jgi:hypothetical protein
VFDRLFGDRRRIFWTSVHIMQPQCAFKVHTSLVGWSVTALLA